ncbi:hypothetical protein G6F57_016837 [Rhizopus arrhizus]|nr:hypothetical protein G6F57_016837 [Rhizopus arrhizus]
MRGSVRAEDACCRVGGEEFLVLMPGASADAASAVAERIREATRAHAMPGGVGHVTVSIGAARWPDDGNDPDTVLKRADQALYQAKTSGRDKVRAGIHDGDAAINRAHRQPVAGGIQREDQGGQSIHAHLGVQPHRAGPRVDQLQAAIQEGRRDQAGLWHRDDGAGRCAGRQAPQLAVAIQRLAVEESRVLVASLGRVVFAGHDHAGALRVVDVAAAEFHRMAGRRAVRFQQGPKAAHAAIGLDDAQIFLFVRTGRRALQHE